MPDVIIRTESGEFLIDAVSGGLSAIIEVGWQVFLRSRDHRSFTVCIDEPENHLHPSLQRSILSSLIDVFPEISFVVATHSPFIVTAVADSAVYVLDYEDGLIVSRLLDTASKAATSDETLRRVLGLETTAPLWVERRLDRVLANFPTAPPTAQDLIALRDELRAIGLGDEFPAAVDALTLSGPSAATE
jgi:AAA domain, putative AbiEii toxin, Type IV TA system